MNALYHTPKTATLLCIPYAGGNRYSYNQFKSFLGDQLEFMPIELPGRGKRVAAPLLFDLETMMLDLYEQIQPYLHRNYILYGHSMGGTLGNLLIHQLKKQQKKLPLLFLVTGCAAPKYKDYSKMLHQLDSPSLVEELRILGGFPEEVLASDELMEFLLPIMRADLQALETAGYQDRGQYPVPITVIAGTDEKNQ